MSKKLIRLTEGDLHRIIKESVNKILNEEYQINHLSHNWDSVNQWRAAAQDLQNKGYVIIHIPIGNYKTFTANLAKTQRNTIQLDGNGINKEFTSISDAFTFLQQYVEGL